MIENSPSEYETTPGYSDPMSVIGNEQGTDDTGIMHRNLDLLRSKGEIGYMFSVLYEAAIAQEPGLADIDIVGLGSADVDELAFTGGYAVHAEVSGTGKHAIVVNTDDGIEHYERLLKERRASVESNMQRMGFDGAALDAKWLAGFIFLHELGHIVDYIRNYPDYEAKMQQRTAEMATLPFPGRNPVEMLSILQQPDGKVWFDKAKDTLQKKYGVDSIESFVALQDRAYRATPMESYADQFAADVSRPFS